MMEFARVHLEGIGYELPDEVVPSAALEERLAPVYDALRVPSGQIEALSGVRERRFWPTGQAMWRGAAAAAERVLAEHPIDRNEIGMLIYAGVCRDNLEPATACAVADAIGVRGAAQVYDVSNACLGVLNGMLQVAAAIELGQIRAGLVVSCESAREIVDTMLARLTAAPSMELFKTTLATLTGGSGAVAVLMTDEGISRRSSRMRGGVALAAPEHHALCRWGAADRRRSGILSEVMETHAVEVLTNGVALGRKTWRQFLPAVGWEDGPDRVICHQVGKPNRDAILKALQLSEEKDFATFPYLGNIGTVSLPMTAAIAEQRGFLRAGHRVGWLGIGSGLNCLMLGLEW